jgi:glycosyltransferase involved in cell wall biosynthesis
MMQVSVVICTYSLDMYDDFRESVESVRRQSYEDVEIIVIVDGTEAVFERVCEDYENTEGIRIYCNDENDGLLKSRNRGAELANGEIIAFIDDDAIAESQWVAELVRGYETQEALAVGGKMNPEWIAGKPEFLPPEFYWLVGVTHRGFADGPGWVRNTFGSNLSIRRDVFTELGGFDTEIGGRKGDKNLQGGETELCVRIAEKYNEQVWYNPDAVVNHKIFEYRTEPRWLMNRAFWQGYSKRAMDVLLPETGNEETEFLTKLLTDSVPEHLRSVGNDRTAAAVMQFVMLFVFTALVGFGYAYGFVNYR